MTAKKGGEKVKKVLITVFLVLFSLSAFAQFEQDTIISQEQLDSIDFSSINLQYEVNQIYYSLVSGVWSLNAGVTFLNATPLGDFYGDGTNYYEIQFTTFTYKAPITSSFGLNYFACAYLGGKEVACFENHVLPTWVNQFLVNDWLHRKFLTSLQTGGAPMIPEALQNYLIG